MQEQKNRAVYQEFYGILCQIIRWARNRNETRWIKRQFMRWPPNREFYHLMLDALFAVTAIIVALKLVNYRGIAMTWFWVFLGIVGFLVIFEAIRICREPKDTRLDTLIEQVSELTKSINKLIDKNNKRKEDRDTNGKD